MIPQNAHPRRVVHRAQRLLARHQSVAVVLVLDLPLRVVVGEPDIVVRGEQQARPLAFEPFGDRCYLLR